ncbi:hypothetical protein BDF19DRAFT_420332 [Syncephalis fuscata]|nr:hypothetical protein BDF19DRAFT_420332 [Syncephalis fuscata]
MSAIPPLIAVDEKRNRPNVPSASATPAMRGRKPPALQMNQSNGVSSRGRKPPPSIPIMPTSAGAINASSQELANNFWSSSGPGSDSSMPKSARIAVGASAPSPGSPVPAPRPSTAGAAAATLLKIHGRPSPGPQSPDTEGTNPFTANAPPVITPPPRTSSLSPQSSPTTIRARGFPLPKDNATAPNNSQQQQQQQQHNNNSPMGKPMVPAMGNVMRKIQSQPSLGPLKQSVSRGPSQAPINGKSPAEDTAGSNGLNGRSTANRWRPAPPPPTSLTSNTASHPITPNASMKKPSTPPSMSTAMAARAATTLKPKMSAPNLSLPSPKTPRCVIPPPPFDPPPEHLIKAQQQEQLRQHGQVGSPGLSPTSPRAGNLATRPIELQRSHSAGSVAQSANTKGNVSPSAPAKPAQMPLLRATSMNSKPPLRPAPSASAAPPTPPSNININSTNPADWEPRPLGYRISNNNTNTNTIISSASSIASNDQPSPQRGWRSRAEESLASESTPKTTEPKAAASAMSTNTEGGKTCDKCNGSGIRTITQISIGPSTAGNSVCSRCRGKGVLRG